MKEYVDRDRILRGGSFSFIGWRGRVTRENGEITEVRVADRDDGMQEYYVVLNRKGREFAEARGRVFDVTGHMVTQGGQRMLTIEEFGQR